MLTLRCVTFAVADPGPVAGFWSSLLDRPARPDEEGTLLPATPTQVGLRFVPTETSAAQQGENWIHLHWAGEGTQGQEATHRRALELGARPVDVGQRPDEGHLVLADPGGNPFCILPDDSAFTAGCGPLAEVACDGSREVGLFYSRLLGWPLVWDEQEETAIQAPVGGTKVAWGGPPVAPAEQRVGQWFEVLADGSDDLARLADLGAVAVADAWFRDPDGSRLRVAD